MAMLFASFASKNSVRAGRFSIPTFSETLTASKVPLSIRPYVWRSTAIALKSEFRIGEHLYRCGGSSMGSASTSGHGRGTLEMAWTGLASTGSRGILLLDTSSVFTGIVAFSDGIP